MKWISILLTDVLGAKSTTLSPNGIYSLSVVLSFLHGCPFTQLSLPYTFVIVVLVILEPLGNRLRCYRGDITVRPAKQNNPMKGSTDECEMDDRLE